MEEMLEKLLLRSAERLRSERLLRRKIQNVEARCDLFLLNKGKSWALRIGTCGGLFAKGQAE
jgi:hypothetical protein